MNYSTLAKMHWLERVKRVEELHISKLKVSPTWRVEDTATMLNRSIGAISEDLLIASWLRTHESQIRKIRTFRDAIAYVREKRHEQRLGL